MYASQGFVGWLTIRCVRVCITTLHSTHWWNWFVQCRSYTATRTRWRWTRLLMSSERWWCRVRRCTARLGLMEGWELRVQDTVACFRVEQQHTIVTFMFQLTHFDSSSRSQTQLLPQHLCATPRPVLVNVLCVGADVAEGKWGQWHSVCFHSLISWGNDFCPVSRHYRDCDHRWVSECQLTS